MIYFDINYINNIIDRKSILKIITFLKGKPIF